MDSKLSTYGLILLGIMILTKYMISTNSGDDWAMLTRAEMEDNYNSWNKGDEQKDIIMEEPAKLYTSRFPISNKEVANISETDNNFIGEDSDNILVLESSEDLENLISEHTESLDIDFNEDEVLPVVSMDYGSSSVVLLLPVRPNEANHEIEDQGNYPLDGGNTISNSINRIFPIHSAE